MDLAAFLDPKAIATGLIAGGACLFARFADTHERRTASVCAALLLVLWINTVLCYTPYGIPAMLPPEVVEYGLGWSGKLTPLPGGLSVDTWAVADTLAGVTILVVARDKWWGKCIYGLLLAGCVFHALYWLRCVSWASYQRGLDVTFMAEEALFFAIGGGGFAAYIIASVGGGGSLFRGRSVLARAQALKRRV